MVVQRLGVRCRGRVKAPRGVVAILRKQLSMHLLDGRRSARHAMHRGSMSAMVGFRLVVVETSSRMQFFDSK
jgi:hypothetical protein